MRPPEIRCLSGLINLGHLCDFSWSLDRRLSALRGILRWLKKLNHRRRPEGNNGRADEFLTSHAAAGSSVLAVATVSVEPIRSPNYGKLQALGLCRRENTTLFREAVDASAIRTARRVTARSGRRG